MSNPEPEQNNFAGASSRQGTLRHLSFGKIAAVFLVAGPPLFGALFWLAVSLANPVGDPLHERIGVAFGVAFSFFGLLASYAVGLLPSLIICAAFAKGHLSAVGVRLVAAALIGAAVYFLAFVRGLDLLTVGRPDGARLLAFHLLCRSRRRCFGGHLCFYRRELPGVAALLA
jgi:hypothetical protein